MLYRAQKELVDFYTTGDKIADLADNGYRIFKIQELTAEEIAAEAAAYDTTEEGQVTEEVTVNG